MILILRDIVFLMCLAAHLLRVTDPSTGRPLEANKLKAEVAAFMAAGRQPLLTLKHCHC
jgi:hypothetical protein